MHLNTPIALGMNIQASSLGLRYKSQGTSIQHSAHYVYCCGDLTPTSTVDQMGMVTVPLHWKLTMESYYAAHYLLACSKLIVLFQASR